VGFHITGYHITPRGTCPQCSASVPGIWPAGEGAPVNAKASRLRYPRRVALAEHS
jgi:hypothetical protein